MFATTFVLLGLIFLTRASSEFNLTKCCPSANVSLTKYNFFLKCVSAPTYITLTLGNIQGITISDFPSESEEKYSYEWDTTTQVQGIPQCNKTEHLSYSLSIFFNPSQGPACQQILYNQMTGENIEMFICQSSKDQQVKTVNASFPPFLLIRKCCPRDEVFDSYTRSCVNGLSESENLVTLLINRLADAEHVVIISSGPPTCKGPVVNYKIDENDVFLLNDTYPMIVPVIKNNVTVKEKLVLSDIACLDMTPDFASDRILIARVCENREFCDTNVCIRKCCPVNELLLAKSEDVIGTCTKLAIEDESMNFDKALAIALNQTQSTFDMTEDYRVLSGYPCNYPNMYAVDPKGKEHGQWLLTSEGHVLFQDTNISNGYCMEILHNNSEFQNGLYLFMCSELNVELWLRWPAAFVISCICLLITLLVYTCLPSLRNLHGKTFTCYLINLFLSLICLWIITLFPPTNVEEKFVEQNSTECEILANVELFFITSALFWLNVICFDMWWTFGAIRENTLTKRTHSKRFMLYCLYAWGCSFLLSVFSYISHSTDILPEYLKYDVEKWMCVYRSNWDLYGALLWNHIPSVILLIANVVFVSLVLRSLNKVKAEIKRLNTEPTNSRNKQLYSTKERFVMTIKLIILMGGWTICGFIEYILHKYLDDENWAVQISKCIVAGYRTTECLLIFILFVLKKRVYQEFRQKIELIIQKRNQ